MNTVCVCVCVYIYIHTYVHAYTYTLGLLRFVDFSRPVDFEKSLLKIAQVN